MQRRQIRLAVIGDSWVGGRYRIDEALRQFLRIPFVTYGYPGAKSLRLYHEIASNGPLLDDPTIGTAVIVGGTNDTTGHRGCGFYARYMTSAAKLLLEHQIHPVIFNCPGYDIGHCEACNVSLLSSLKHSLYRIVFDRGQQDVISRYRCALKKRLRREGIYRLVTLVEFCADFSCDYTEDKRHLNPHGQKKLAAAIAEVAQTWLRANGTVRAT